MMRPRWGWSSPRCAKQDYDKATSELKYQGREHKRLTIVYDDERLAFATRRRGRIRDPPIYVVKDLSRRNVAMPPYFHGWSGYARRSGERNGLGDTAIGP